MPWVKHFDWISFRFISVVQFIFRVQFRTETTVMCTISLRPFLAVDLHRDNRFHIIKIGLVVLQDIQHMHEITVFFPLVIAAWIVCYSIQTVDIQLHEAPNSLIEAVSVPVPKIMRPVEFYFILVYTLRFTTGSTLVNCGK